MKLSQLKSNPNNPRLIKDNKFKKLVQSIKDFPEMLEKRPIVCVTDTDGMLYPLGGNMRLKALQELKFKDIPDTWITMADDWNIEQKKEFIIKDNVSGGEWDWSMLANEWNSEELEEWGLAINNFESSNIDLDSFFEEDNTNKEDKFKITLEYTEDDFNAVQEALKKHSGSKESIFFKLLGL